MKRLYDEKLLGNKLTALALVITMNLSLLSEIAPLVWILCLPTAIILTFTKTNYCN